MAGCDGTFGRIFGHKVCSIIGGLIHLGLSLWLFISIVLSGFNTTVAEAVSCLASVVFCVLLLIGILKKNKYFVMSYLLYNVLYLMLLIVASVLIMVKFDLTVSLLFQCLFNLFLRLLIFFVVFTYYVTTHRS